MNKTNHRWYVVGTLLLMVAAAVILSACGGTTPAPTAAAPTEVATAAATEAATTAATEAATQATGGIDCMGAKKGDTVSMLYQWSGNEEENLNKIVPLLHYVEGSTVASAFGPSTRWSRGPGCATRSTLNPLSPNDRKMNNREAS